MENELLKKILETVERLDHGLGSLRSEMNVRFDGVNTRIDEVSTRIDEVSTRIDEVSTRIDGVSTRIDGVDLKLSSLQESVNRIEAAQQEDVVSILQLINSKLDDTAKRSDVDGLRGDIEFVVKENSIFTLELDRLKRNNYNE